MIKTNNSKIQDQCTKLEIPFAVIENKKQRIYLIIKRIMDISLSLFILLFALPLMLLIVIAIKIDSPGPAIFKHIRAGKSKRQKGNLKNFKRDQREKDLFGQQFGLYKFRTMYYDSKQRFSELYKYDYTNKEFESMTVGKPFPGGNSTKTDPRLTRVGRWLRKTSLDELPNFINVLKGDLSIIGPRPDIWQHIRYYPKHHLEKFKVKPGITCLAQIKGRGKLSFLKTNEYDLEYIQNPTLLKDFEILAKTIIAVFKREGAF